MFLYKDWANSDHKGTIHIYRVKQLQFLAISDIEDGTILFESTDIDGVLKAGGWDDGDYTIVLGDEYPASITPIGQMLLTDIWRAPAFREQLTQEDRMYIAKMAGLE
jgi:hypothetical protein